VEIGISWFHLLIQVTSEIHGKRCEGLDAQQVEEGKKEKDIMKMVEDHLGMVPVWNPKWEERNIGYFGQHGL
jgi:hypothetical protein